MSLIILGILNKKWKNLEFSLGNAWVPALYRVNMKIKCKYFELLGVVKRNPLFLYEIEWKNNGFLFTTPNIKYLYNIISI